MRCGSHALNLLVLKLFQVDCFQNIFADASFVIHLFSKGHALYKKLSESTDEYVKVMGMGGATRFSSQISALEVLSHNAEAIKHFQPDQTNWTPRKKQNYKRVLGESSSFWIDVEVLLQIFRPLKQIITKSESTTYRMCDFFSDFVVVSKSMIMSASSNSLTRFFFKEMTDVIG
ncbi:unnamed protein product [Ambrosiozyma monospora]|uniref:Unnamed protein product n=1 Tax=Ambrosiozyma monospora TaxID=43982 RepID=A0A9W6Z2B1_AMBMO|nr:unnamed protein product [Ambrosiozyma monospora]